MSRRILSVVITKNRPHIFGVCVESFFRCAESLDLLISTVIVVNDSDTNTHIAQYDAILSKAGTACRSELLHLTKHLSALPGPGEHVVKSSETLGSSSWCPSRARNCALEAIRRLASRDDIVLFFDDDIVFESGTYRGTHFRSAGRSVLQESVRVVEHDNQAVVGCRYNGRADISLAEHLAHYTRQLLAMKAQGDCTERAMRLAEQLLAYPDLPLFVHDDEVMQEKYQGPGGLSLGFLALSAQMLPAVRFPNIYNEDWFWIEALSRRGARYVHLSHALLHAPDACFGFSAERALFQEIGDVIWNTVMTSAAGQSEGKCRLGALHPNESLDQISAMKRRKVRNLEDTLRDIQEIQRLYERRHTQYGTGISFIPEALCSLHADVSLLKQSLEDCTLSYLFELVDKALQYQASAAGAPPLLNASSAEWDIARRQAEWGEIQRMVTL